MIKILDLIEKIFAVMCVAPPMYMAYRFIRWYLRQSKEEAETTT
jgi:hypothetical protein